MSREVRIAIGGRLKQARADVGLTQAQAARELGVDRRAVSSWEHGKTMPRCDEWYKIGPLYGVSLDYLVYGVRTIPVSESAILGAVFRPQEEAAG
jgi:transcriptional regulator with XRE-family HTH domain